MKYGIDVSSYQGTIDWKMLHYNAPEVKFAILRTGYSFGDAYNDKKFHSNVYGCKEAGIEIYGVYHFSYALCVKDAILEARECVKRMKAADLPSSTIAFFDFEYDSERFCKDNGVTCDSKFIQQVTAAFCDEIRDSGYTPGVYTNVDYYTRMYKGVLPENVKVWAAKWLNVVGNTISKDFNMDDIKNAKKQPPFVFDLWQYGGREIPGLGMVDADVILVDDEEVKMESRKSNEEIATEVIRGDWGNGAERRRRLEEAGYNYRAVQDIVNTRLGG